MNKLNKVVYYKLRIYYCFKCVKPSQIIFFYSPEYLVIQSIYKLRDTKSLDYSKSPT